MALARKPTASKSSTNKSHSKKPLKTINLARGDSDDGPEPPAKRHRASFMLSNPPVFDLTKDDATIPSSSQCSASSRLTTQPVLQSQRSTMDVKGKGKETRTSVEDEAESLWVDKYEPTSEAELAVHKRKVEDVRRWLLEAFESGPSAKLRKYRRILALTGPAGTAKTSTLRVLSRELDFEILEWRNSMSERGSASLTDDDPHLNEGPSFQAETLFDKFQAFLTRATTCRSIFGHHNISQTSQSGSLVPPCSQTQASTQRSGRRQLILLEDLPNLLHQPTQTRFQAALRSLCIPASALSEPGPPIVIILSDSGLRAENPDDDMWDGGSNRRRWDKKEVLDIRNVLGPELLTSPYVTNIRFNPIAPTLMTKALQALLASHYGSSEAHERVGKRPPREIVDIIVGSSNGDIRSSIMALQFACVVDLPASSAKSKGNATLKKAGGTKRTTNARTILEAVTRREQSLVLFHLMGKILYNKRKFDPPASRLSAKDAAKERELDVQLVDPPPLPAWLSHHNRKTSRVCTEAVTAESPIDSSLLGMYTHQNYTQFCTDIDQCDGICEGLSWVDWTDGSASSPYAFPTLTLSTLHSLPTPVPRSGQKVCKPAWFSFHTKELEASDAVGDVLGWLGKGMSVGGDMDDGASPSSVGRWTHSDVATEFGGWLRAVDRCGGRDRSMEGESLGGPYPEPPRSHRLFSHLLWSRGAVEGDVLGENEDWEEEEEEEEEERPVPGGRCGVSELVEGKGWLEDDDIEDID